MAKQIDLSTGREYTMSFTARVISQCGNCPCYQEDKDCVCQFAYNVDGQIKGDDTLYLVDIKSKPHWKEEQV